MQIRLPRIITIISAVFVTTMAGATTPRYTITPPADVSLFSARNITLAAGATVASINSAISTVSTAGGGEVSLANGTYLITEPIRMRSRVRLKGTSRTGVLLRRADTWQPTAETGIIIAGEALSDIVIQDLTIDGTGYIAGLLHGVMLIDNTYGTLRRLRLSNLTVRNCAGGVHIKGSQDVLIADSDISANGGLEAYWHNIYLRRCTRARVTNCTLNDSPTGSGFQSTDSHHIRVDRCTVSGNFWRGIRSAGASTYVLVDGNTVTNNGRYGIGNNFETTTAPSYFCYIDNIVSGNRDYGINTNGSSSFGQVVNNLCTGNTPGDYRLNGTDIEFSDAVVLPAPPSGLVVTPARNRLELSWNGSASSATFNVKRSASAAGPFATLASELATNAFTDTGLVAGTTWFYKISATNSLGTSPDSSVVAATVPSLLAGSIIGTEGSWNNTSTTTRTAAFDGSLATFFDAPSDAAFTAWVGLDLGAPRALTGVRFAPRTNHTGRMLGGRIQGSNSATFSSGVEDLFVISNAPPSGVLTEALFASAGSFRYVRYLTASNQWCNIAELEFYAALPSAPLPPAGLAAEGGQGLIELTWQPSAGAATYTLSRSTSASGPFVTIAAGLTTPSYSDSGLSAGSTFHYLVVASGPGGDGPASTSVSATTHTLREIWRLEHFGTLSEIGTSSDTADPDQDGLSNLLEYATNMDPLQAGGTSPVSAGLSGHSPPRLQITFTRVADPSLVYTVEATEDLGASWAPLWHSTGVDNLPGPVTVAETETLAGKNRRFLRLKVTP